MMAFVGLQIAAVKRTRGVVQCTSGRDESPVAAQSSSSRRGFLVSGAWLCTGLITGSTFAAEATEDKIWKGPDSLGFSFKYPSSWNCDKKQIKSHLSQVQFDKDGTSVSGNVTVDQAKLKTVKEIGTPEQTAEKMFAVEMKRDSSVSVKTLSATSLDLDGLTYYDIEYEINGKNGTRHLFTRITINDTYFYKMTVSAKETEYSSVQNDIQGVVKSFYVKKSYLNS